MFTQKIRFSQVFASILTTIKKQHGVANFVFSSTLELSDFKVTKSFIQAITLASERVKKKKNGSEREEKALCKRR